jgi:lipopolysaccharide heptosyltransferase II
MIKYIAKKTLENNMSTFIKKTILNRNKRPLSFDKLKNILCIQMNAIGDCIMTQPVFAALKSIIPDARIDLICRPHIAPIFKNDPSIDSILTFRTEKYRNWLFKKRFQLEGMLRNGNYDVLIDFTAIPLTAAICSKDGVPPSIGFKRLIRTTKGNIDLGSAYDLYFDYSESLPIRDLMFRLISTWSSKGTPQYVPHIYLNDMDIKEAVKILNKKHLREKKYIVLHTGAKWIPKRWPKSYWKKLIEISANHTVLPYLIVGNSTDKDFIFDILDLCNSKEVSVVFNQNLTIAAALIKMSRLCICNDSAAMHISAAVGTPSIAIFGPVSPKRSAPTIDEGCNVMYNKEFCSPCTLYYSKKRCRRGLNFCMRAINPEKVFNKIEELLLFDNP